MLLLSFFLACSELYFSFSFFIFFLFLGGGGAIVANLLWQLVYLSQKTEGCVAFFLFGL